jgi:thiol-disulfide isomerase/thioredoxin
MHTREGMTMKPFIAKTIYAVIALLFLVSLVIISVPSKGKELAVQKMRPLPILVDLGRGTCTPCKMMVPTFKELKKEYAGVLNIELIDIRDQPEALKKYNVRGIPFQIVLTHQEKSSNDTTVIWTKKKSWPCSSRWALT